MGICESNKNMNKPGKTTEKVEQIKINKSLKINEINETTRTTQLIGIVQECKIINSPFEEFNSNVAKSICKIKIITQKETKLEKKYGSGFLLKWEIAQEMFYCFMTNEHVISKDIINNNNSTVYIFYDKELKIINIKWNEKERYIKRFNDIGLDITVIEILDNDNVSKDYFLFPKRVNEYYRLINSQVYVPQYPKDKGLKNARGKIKEINKYKFTHLASTGEGSSGSPIFLENSDEVIGIHKQGNLDKSENYGDFIYPAINIIEKDIIERRRNKGKYDKGKYIWEDGKYYKVNLKIIYRKEKE